MLPADHGDCLWLEYGEAGSTHAVLIDGGPSDTYRKAIRPRIEAFAEGRGRTPRIELMVVTHIDNDHILGALDLLGDSTLDVEIGEIWFNGWDQITTRLTRGTRGVREGIALTKAIQARRIAHNTTFGGRAAAVDPINPARTYTLPGGLVLTLLSPGPTQLLRLRDAWQTVLAEAEEQPTRGEEVLCPSTKDVEELAARTFQPDTAPANGSSIALLAEYDAHRLLLAADSFAPVVVASLRALGYSESNRLTLDAYKLSHHGSRGNNSRELLRLISCRNYMFSTSGSRFGHPHDECVARVLVEGGEAPNIHSNYRRGRDMLWSLKTVENQYRHRLFQPASSDETILLEFNRVQ